MTTTRIVLLAIAVLALGACARTKVLETWESDSASMQEPGKVAVLVVWPDQLQRLVIERDMVRQIRDAGANAVESSEIPGMRGELSRENVEVALRNAEADSVIIVFIIGGGTSGSFERADYWLQNVGGGVGGWYSPYFYDVYAVREGPGWTDKKQKVRLETTYVDVSRVERVWSMVTESDDIEHQDVAARLTDKVIRQMKKAGQI